MAKLSFGRIGMGLVLISALAITAFVFSIIGFFGFTAVLGILLGIAGIFATRGAQRRGRGLAIAALPISVVTGLLGLLLLIGIIQIYKMADLTTRTEKMLARSDDVRAVADDIYAHSSASFRQTVSSDQLAAWLDEVQRKHGNLVSLDRNITMNSMTRDAEYATFHYPGKFVNGPALVELRFEVRSLTQPLVDDIEVDGSSPRPRQSE